MPIYEYQCSECNKIIEIFQRNHFKDNLPKCRECNIEMNRIISKNSFILKGSCWAKDGYQYNKLTTHENCKTCEKGKE